MMKILFLSYYSGQSSRGVETFVDAIASRLVKKHEVMVIQSGIKKTNLNYQIVTIGQNKPLSNTNTWLSRYMIDGNSLGIAQFTLKALKNIHKFKPEVIIPTNLGWQAFIIKIYGWLFKAKWVISGQVGKGKDERWSLLLKPDLYIALSQNTHKRLAREYPRQKLAQIPNGVDLDKFKPKNRDIKTTFSEINHLQKPIILIVAGPEKYKRIYETVRAVHQLGNASLVLAGGDQDIENYGKQVLKDRFFRIKTPHDQMPDIYQSADLFSLCSTGVEGFGIAYLEAMAANLPVVATDDNLRREIIGNAGLFVKDPANITEYTQVLQKALAQEWANKPRLQAEKYNWNNIALQYESEFKKLNKSRYISE